MITEPKIPQPGQIFTERQLYEIFSVRNSGGIRYSNQHNTVLLIDSDSGPYDDHVDEESGNIIYTGAGERDQDFDSKIGKQNAHIRYSKTYTLLYFHKPENNKYVFKYPVKYESYYDATEKNSMGIERKVIKFRLKIVQT